MAKHFVVLPNLHWTVAVEKYIGIFLYTRSRAVKCSSTASSCFARHNMVDVRSIMVFYFTSGAS